MLQKKELLLDGSTYKKKALIYTDTNDAPRAAVLYFHGGGLLYGQKTDLPDYHLNRMTQAGYAVISYDYPLAPATKLDQIVEDICASIRHYTEHGAEYLGVEIPYFLWGRSAGAYLCLIAASGSVEAPSPAPLGILSYYGYGFLCDNWYNTPSAYYRTLPAVDESCLRAIPKTPHASGNLDTHYSVYVHARQTGSWIDLIYEGREKYFYLNYSLRVCPALPCPLFCAHSTNDNDVPYEEFLELSSRFHAKRFIASCDTHDFDRDTDNPFTQKLLDESIAFLDQHS